MLIAVFTISGVVPTIVYYGLNILNAQFILPVTFIITAIVASALGSS